MLQPNPADAFIVFDAQDSGCLSYGIESAGQRWFVKTPKTSEAAAALTRALALHAAVQHETIVCPEAVFDGTEGPTLVYPWCDGTLLNHATIHGSDRSGLARFQQLPVPEVEAALDAILEAHVAITIAGYVAVDLYDGCFLYDFDAHRMHLIDLDGYRPRPFILSSDRLPGSRRYMAPEEFIRGASIDHRTTVHALGRTLHHLLDAPAGWRGTADQQAVIRQATEPEPSNRYPDPPALAYAWQRATRRCRPSGW
ncbi:serine/threonine protein kinase [Micromonospora soli]|uniref:serine/threonine protein kinase n=1 Tax=Micromonospora sp. NBRC 110009 TaxID=3061627 RepID=UPI0026722462|nr:serine/threonine protein kinase [Micromonospora sp. NBRC 110009]WKT97043.1 serine/threonine protein kinase [Micromonospora sp. NBRC 110009]